jgi:predicted amidohydrolase
MVMPGKFDAAEMPGLDAFDEEFGQDPVAIQRKQRRKTRVRFWTFFSVALGAGVISVLALAWSAADGRLRLELQSAVVAPISPRTREDSEEEIDRLRHQVEALRNEITKLKDARKQMAQAIAALKAAEQEPRDPNDLEALRRAQEAAAPFNLPVMIHIGQSFSPMRAILPLLKRGDVVTHMYAPAPNGILDEKGRLFPDVAAARRRGVIFDFGNGVFDHFDWATVERATKQGFWPDTISTDWNVMSKTTCVIDFPNVMSKFIMFGMPLSQIIACATVNAARVFPSFDDRGTLNVGAPADVAIMELRDGTFEFLDNYKGTRTGHQRLFPAGTVLAGKQVQRA